MDAFELLKTDHEKVSGLFKRIESVSGKAKVGVFNQIKHELEVHTQIEETILYPALKNAEETRDLTLEAYEEHRIVKDLLAELAAAKPGDQWDAKLTVLKENVEHHVEEEEGELFKKANGVLSREEVESLGDQMAREKEKLGAPVSSEVKKPGLIKTVVQALFGSKTKLKAGKKKAAKASPRSRAAKRPTTKKTANKKTTKPAAKKVATRTSPKRTVKKSTSKKRSRAKESR
jgi:hemerythrin-like domain-containing protein